MKKYFIVLSLLLSVATFCQQPLFHAHNTGDAPPPTFAPTDLSNLQIWTRADQITASDNDEIATWSDLSGNSNHLTSPSGAKPVYKTGILNSKPVLRFGSGDYMMFTNLVAQPNITAFLVHKTTGDNILISGANSYATQFMRIGESTNPTSALYYDGAVYYSSSFSVARTSFSLMEVKKAGGTLSWYENGNSKGSASVTNIDAIIRFLGASGGDGTAQLTGIDGDVAELIIYNSALSDTDRQSVETYLKNKYALY